MAPNGIVKKFTEIIGIPEDNINRYYIKNKNTIRIFLTNGNEYIFTYVSNKKWRFETVESYFYGFDNISKKRVKNAKN